MDLEQIRDSAKSTAESRATFEKLLERFNDIYSRRPQAEAAAQAVDYNHREIYGIYRLDDHEILRLRQEIPRDSAALAKATAEDSQPVVYVKIVHDCREKIVLEAHSYITYLSSDVFDEDGNIVAESLESDPLYHGKEIVHFDPHSVYPAEFIDDKHRRSMDHAFDIVDQSADVLL